MSLEINNTHTEFKDKILELTNIIEQKIHDISLSPKEMRNEIIEIEELRQILSDYINEQSRRHTIIVETGNKLLQELDQHEVLEVILKSSMDITCADAGTVYLKSKKDGEELLSFEVVNNKSQNTSFDDQNQGLKKLNPVQLIKDGKENHANVSAHCVLTGKVLNIPDVHDTESTKYENLDFSGVKKYDETTGYQSKSMLVIPLRDHEMNVIGALQLINRKDREGKTIPFTNNDEESIQLNSQVAARALTTKNLLEERDRFFDEFIQMLIKGLGEKSPHTACHIERIAEEVMPSIVHAINKNKNGPYADIFIDEKQQKSYRLGALLHDIGKLITPEHIVSKITKLDYKLDFLVDNFVHIVDRADSKIKDIKLLFEIERTKIQENTNKKLKKLLKNTKLKQHYINKRLNEIEQYQTSKLERINNFEQDEIDEIVDVLQQLIQTNLGGENMNEGFIKLINKAHNIKLNSYLRTEFSKNKQGKDSVVWVELSKSIIEKPLIDEEERERLLIKYGTLSEMERQVINKHAEDGRRWLSTLSFPDPQTKIDVLEWTRHHEKLHSKQSLTARIAAISDLFEAISAPDRPYRDPKKLSTVLLILGNMTKNNVIDAEIMKIFLESEAHLKYAKKHLSKKNINIDETHTKEWIEKYYPKDFHNKELSLAFNNRLN